jgi:hypothetical protein
MLRYEDSAMHGMVQRWEIHKQEQWADTTFLKKKFHNAVMKMLQIFWTVQSEKEGIFPRGRHHIL